ncbi:MAG TPA: hypothetical protein V6D18_06755 [Thermosynechococcaceae cyanobacterium]
MGKPQRNRVGLTQAIGNLRTNLEAKLDKQSWVSEVGLAKSGTGN